MNSLNPARVLKAAPLLGFASVALLSIPILILLAVVGVTGYFRLSSDASALRQSFMTETKGSWQKKFAIHVGPLTTGFVRLCSHWVKLPPEPKAALEAIQGAEVGIYKLQGDAMPLDAGAVLVRADKAMSWRGWERAIGVSKEQELVAIYFPRRGFSSEHLKCCLLVCQGRDLVIVSARGNLEPLLETARRKVDMNKLSSQLAVN